MGGTATELGLSDLNVERYQITRLSNAVRRGAEVRNRAVDFRGRVFRTRKQILLTEFHADLVPLGAAAGTGVRSRPSASLPVHYSLISVRHGAVGS